MTRLFNTFLFCMYIVAQTTGYAETALEPWIYSEDFETREENAWASYPLWQDTAYDPNFKVGTIVPGDGNISIVQTVQPYSHVDNYAGAQKLLDMYLVSGSSISLRYYIKSHLPAEFLKVILAAGSDGKVDFTVQKLPKNRWERLTVTFADVIRQNPRLSVKDRIKVNALALLVKIPSADPDMAFQFGLDDVTVKGARAVQFQFIEPKVYTLSEWKHRYAIHHYGKGETFTLRGRWPLAADRVSLKIVSFADTSKTWLVKNLSKNGDSWSLEPSKISFPEGMYLSLLTALGKGGVISESSFTFIVALENLGGRHPRLLFDSAKLDEIKEKLKRPEYSHILKDIVSRAESSRKDNPLETVIYDYDQFNDVDLIADLGAWSNRFHPWGYGIEANALAYAFTGDRAAAEYAIGLLEKQCRFPSFSHPWMEKRGRHAYWQCQQADNFAIGYDILYHLMDENQRRTIREGIIRNFIQGSFRTFVEDNAVTNSTSNWIAHMAGSPLMCLAAMYGDDPDDKNLEPYFTGLIYKTYDHIVKGTVPGAYGEGFGYYGFSMTVWSQLLPALERNFGIDLSKTLNGSYQEAVWGGNIKEKKSFYFGDSSARLSPISDFAWLLPKYRDPLLGWLYNYLKDNETLQDLLYDTENVPRGSPFDENPVRLFRNVGTTVFKSGWEKDDFIFVFRSGPFYNHQHFDKGTFWLSDYSYLFIEERYGGSYEHSPHYRPLYTKPYAHSTILIDGNRQSQRAGDPFNFADGFNDFAYVDHFLNCGFAAFSSNDLDGVYWGKVADLKRNVLYLKPRTILMLDTVVPAERDVDVSILFQTMFLKDIEAGTNVSTITKDGKKLFVYHLNPEYAEIKPVETPHYDQTMYSMKPLVKEGMLTVIARTNGIPLVIGNLLTTTTGGEPSVTISRGEGCVTGVSSGIPFAFTTSPSSLYETDGILTDALAVAWKDSDLFAVLCTRLSRNGALVLESHEPVTFELSKEGIRYYVSRYCEAAFGVQAKQSEAVINGKTTRSFRFDAERRSVKVTLPKGEGKVVFK